MYGRLQINVILLNDEFARSPSMMEKYLPTLKITSTQRSQRIYHCENPASKRIVSQTYTCSIFVVSGSQLTDSLNITLANDNLLAASSPLTLEYKIVVTDASYLFLFADGQVVSSV